jgi:hypothetical protein
VSLLQIDDAELAVEAAVQPTDVAAWLERIRAFRDSVPAEEWSTLPADLAENLDEYLYGGREFPA